MIAWASWGVPATGNAIYEAISSGRIDHYVVRPSRPPDELFHHAISGWLLEWAESQRCRRTRSTSSASRGRAGPTSCGSSSNCAIPTRSRSRTRRRARPLAQAGGEGGLPLVIFPDGTVLRDPTDAESWRPRALRSTPAERGLRPPHRGCGSGRPVRRGPRRVRRIQHPGGRPGGHRWSGDVELPDPQLPRLRAGRERSSARAAGVRAGVGLRRQLRLPARVTDLRRDETGLAVTLSDSGRVRGRAVLLATGAAYQRIGIPALEALNGAGVFYGGTASEDPAWPVARRT